MAGKSSGDRRKPRGGKGGKNAAPAKAIRVGVIDYKDVATLRKFISERGRSAPAASPVSPCRSSVSSRGRQERARDGPASVRRLGTLGVTMSKLILTHEVTGLGSAGDVVEVKNGYARNYLIPQGFAVAWTPRRREAGRLDQGRSRRSRARHARRGSGPQGAPRGDGRQAHRQGRRRGPPVRLGQDRRRRRRGRGRRPRRDRQAPDRARRSDQDDGHARGDPEAPRRHRRDHHAQRGGRQEVVAPQRVSGTRDLVSRVPLFRALCQGLRTHCSTGMRSVEPSFKPALEACFSTQGVEREIPGQTVFGRVSPDGIHRMFHIFRTCAPAFLRRFPQGYPQGGFEGALSASLG